MKNDWEILSSCFLFRGIAPDPQTAFPAPTEVPRGAVIYDETTYRRALGIVVAGRAAATAPGSDTVLNEFGVGAVFGAAAVFSPDEGYVSRIVAKSDCRIVFLDEPFLRELFARYPKTAENYIAFLSGKIRFLNGKLALFTANGAAARVYEYLKKNGGAGDAMAALARKLGIGRTTLYRVLDELEQKEMIVRKDGKIEVLQ